MTDTTDKALDARIIRANPTDGMYAVQDGGWVRYEALIDLRRECDALRAQLATAHSERDAAIAAMTEAARKRGEAEGKLAASEIAGVVEGWRDRALKAEAQLAKARADALREAHERLWDKLGGQCRLEACDIVEALINTPTPSAPSPEAVARAAWERAIAVAKAHKSTEGVIEALRKNMENPVIAACVMQRAGVAKAGGGE